MAGIDRICQKFDQKLHLRAVAVIIVEERRRVAADLSETHQNAQNLNLIGTDEFVILQIQFALIMLKIRCVELLLFFRKINQDLLFRLIRKFIQNILLHTAEYERPDSKIQLRKLFLIVI